MLGFAFRVELCAFIAAKREKTMEEDLMDVEVKPVAVIVDIVVGKDTQDNA